MYWAGCGVAVGTAFAPLSPGKIVFSYHWDGVALGEWANASEEAAASSDDGSPTGVASFHC
jgi:hypothetical protein